MWGSYNNMSTITLRERLELASVAQAVESRFKYVEKRCIGLGGMGVVYEEPYQQEGWQVLQKVTLITKDEHIIRYPEKGIVPLKSVVYEDKSGGFGQVVFKQYDVSYSDQYDLSLADFHSLKVAVSEYYNLRALKGIGYFQQSVTDFFCVDTLGECVAEDREFFLLDGQLCVRTIMSKVPGQTLDYLLRPEAKKAEGLMPLDVVRIAYDMACALSVLGNDKKIVHRDLSPANIVYRIRYDEQGKVLYGKGDTYLIDFGNSTRERACLEQLVDNNDVKLLLTQDERGWVVGTPGFMAPELLLGKEVERYADRWSLGCVLYLLMTGMQPFARHEDAMRFQDSYTPLLRQDLEKYSPYNFDFIDAVMDLFYSTPKLRKVESLILEAEEILNGTKECLRESAVCILPGYVLRESDRFKPTICAKQKLAKTSLMFPL